MKHRDGTLQDMDENALVERAEGAAFLRAKPTISESRKDPRPPASDEALRLTHQILLKQGEHRPRLLVFAGMGQNDFCRQICRSVTEILAYDTHRSVCFVGANLRSMSPLSPVSGTKNIGLSEALRHAGSIRSFCRPINPQGNLWQLPEGTFLPDAPELLTSDALPQRMAELRSEFDYVMVEAPSLGDYPDAIRLGQLADGVVLILEGNVTRRDAATTAVTMLRNAKVPILAAALVEASPKTRAADYLQR